MVSKRIFDLFFALFGLIILFPVFLIIAIFIKIRMSPGPVFFSQLRIGWHGKLFMVIKFRTMTIDHKGNSISVKGESRITSMGKTLRKYKLDELPELWNVLKGEMSFVGPRPDVPGYTDKLKGGNRKLLLLQTGHHRPSKPEIFQ